MGILFFLFVIVVLILFSVHGLSAVQLYKQRGLGPQAMPSIVILSVLWLLGFLFATINLIAYLTFST